MRLISFLTLLIVNISVASASPILFIDDDEGLSGESSWFSSMTNLGYTFDVETLGLDGNPLANLAQYSAVIWSVGDRGYNNLTAQNVQAMKTYLDQGGSLLYSGGMSLFYEPQANALATDYFGLSSYHANLSIFGETSMNGTGGSVVGSRIYSVSPWVGGEYGIFMSGFNTGSAQSMFLNPSWSTGGPYSSAVNVRDNFSAMVWGFDLNHLSFQDEREELLGASLSFLSPTAYDQSQEEIAAEESGDTTIAEPAPLALIGLGLFGMFFMRKRRFQ